MGIAIASFLAVFLLVLSGGLLIFYRETIQARISAAINPQVKQQKTLKTTLIDTREVLEGVVERFEKVVPRSEDEVGVVQQRLLAGRIVVEEKRDLLSFQASAEPLLRKGDPGCPL